MWAEESKANGRCLYEESLIVPKGESEEFQIQDEELNIERIIQIQMNNNTLDFATFCIGNLSRRLGLPEKEIYHRLKTSGILSEYIVPSYDVLHTFSKEYLMEDLTDFMREKGVLN